MTAEEIKQTQKQYVMQSWSMQSKIDPIPIERADNIYVYDYDGRRYADMSSMHVNMNLGYGNAAINQAIRDKLERYAFISEAYADADRAALGKLIVSLMPDNMGKVFFTNAGADANENAIKIARMYTGRNKIFSRYRSYHGSTFGAGNLTGEPRRFALEPGVPGFIKFLDPYVYRDNLPFASEADATAYYLRRLEEQLLYENPANIAAIVMETVAGTNGVIIPPEGYLPGVRALCDKYGILMICDEVMAGWCRTGRMFAFEHFGVKPDIVTFAKGVTCGYVQLGGVCVSREIAAYFDNHILSCGLTYNGHPLACAAGVACVSYYLEHHTADYVAETGKVLGTLLEHLKETHPCVGDVRYLGLFSAVELVKDKDTRTPLVPYGCDPEGVMPGINRELRSRGFLTFTHENMILVAPPLIITPAQLEEELAKLDAVLYQVDAAL
ncbi:MAG: aminotransferase class III-fold pyridoxal phosphate-dependent enzyme [Oscillospiraceae bacterium]|nr:aminotransferase class III-fold pyridoxal phosphate-dependent enzyme [Oscillospiraceae bacterium]